METQKVSRGIMNVCNFNDKISEENGVILFEKWQKEISKLIYFPANLNYNLETDVDSKFQNRSIIDFSQDEVSTVWNLILEKIQNYQEQELKIRQDISKVVEKSSSDLKAIQEEVRKLED